MIWFEFLNLAMFERLNIFKKYFMSFMSFLTLVIYWYAGVHFYKLCLLIYVCCFILLIYYYLNTHFRFYYLFCLLCSSINSEQFLFYFIFYFDLVVLRVNIIIFEIIMYKLSDLFNAFRCVVFIMIFLFKND